MFVQALKDGGLWLILQILSFISWGVSFAAQMSGKLVNWVIGPDFLGGLSYTNPASNPIIQTGLNVTQSLVNMILVLILIYIALATILRIQNYQAQKLLPVFIVIALLVNFTPVICGLIVDTSNILMNFFVERVHADRFGELVKASLDSNAVDPNSQTGTFLYNQVVQLCFLIPFMVMLTFIMLVFAAIFALRHIAIWMLVILSPLAFIAFILPVTKKWWSMWWNQFINWCFVGVTLGFFLYLSLFFMIKIPSAPPSGSMPSIATQQFTGAIGFLTGIIFLGAGLVFGLKTSAMGASTAINLSRLGQRKIVGLGWKGTKKIARGTGKVAGGAARRTGLDRVGRTVEDYGARALTRLGNWKIPGLKEIPGVGNLMKPFAFLKWVTPKKFIRDAGNVRPQIEEAEKNAQNRSGAKSSQLILTESVIGTEAVGELIKTLKGNDAQDMFKEAKKIGMWKKLSDEQIVKNKEFARIVASILKTASEGGMLSSIVRRDPRLAQIAAEYKIGSYVNEDGSKMSDEKAVSKATGQARVHINDWEPEELNSKHVTRSVLANFEEDRMLQLNRNVKDGQKTFLYNMDKDFSNFARSKSSLKNNNDADLKILLSDPNSTNYQMVWKEYEREIQKLYGGNAGFGALESKRVQDRGYRKAVFLTKNEYKETASGDTAGDAAGLVERESEELKSIRQKIIEERQKTSSPKGILEKLKEKRTEEKKLENILERRKRKGK